MNFTVWAMRGSTGRKCGAKLASFFDAMPDGVVGLLGKAQAKWRSGV
ncbi:hypothetical protein IDM48_10625 [Rothia amarae]|uniref:Uncharacterized protein n=1 Tax=Rothia amarae TaxID=169480 RepID=A0A7H2BJE0_9MICC|nr:hypothetical protein [Rothia amarae]QNV39786.1 hypothetical protein IDM48_10625 [Rothia amarae]